MRGKKDKIGQAQDGGLGVLFSASAHDSGLSWVDPAEPAWWEASETRALIELIPALVFVTDREGANVFTNQRFQQYTGLTASELLGDGWLAALHSDDRARAKEIWRTSVGSEEPYEAEYRLRSADGEFRWHIVRATAVARNGAAVRWIGTCADIDDQKRHELITGEEARCSEARFRTVFQSMFNLIGLLDGDGTLLEANAAALAFGGVSAAEVIGRKFWDTPWWDVGEEERQRLKSAVAQAGTGQFVRYEARVKAAGGRLTQIDFTLKPVFDAGGRVVEIILEGRDLCEFKAAQAAIRGSEERLAAKVEALGTLQGASTMLVAEDRLETILGGLLDASLTLMHSDCASVQILDRQKRQLRLVDHRGFHPESAAFWEWVDADSDSSCGAALGTRTRVLVADVESSEAMAGTADRDAYLRSGIRAVQSTPLLSRTGELVGMMSTHWREPRLPPERDLLLFDVLARQAADAIERIRARDELAAREQQLRALFENQFQFAAILAPDYSILEISRSATRAGLIQGEIVGRSFLDLPVWPREAVETWRTQFDEARDASRSSVREERYRTQGEAEDSWALNVVTAVRDTDGRLAYWVVEGLDVTDLKRAEGRSQELSRTLRLAINAADAAAFVWDIGSDVVTRLHSQEPALPVSPAGPATFEDIVQVVHPDDRALFRANVDAGLTCREGRYLSEHRLLRPDGEIRWMSEHGQVEFAADGRPLRLNGVAIDITGRKAAEDGLQRQLERQALLLDVSRVLIGARRDAGELAAAVVERIAPTLGADVCFNYRVDAAAGDLSLLFERGVPEDLHEAAARLELDQAFCGTVAASRRSLVADAGRIATDPKGAFVHGMGVTAYACHPLFASDGRILGTFSLASTTRDAFADEDVSFLQTVSNMLAQAWERCAAERELREKEARLDLAMRASATGVWDFDLATGRVTWSGLIYRIFGVDHFEGTKEAFFEFVHPEDRDRLGAAVDTAVTNSTMQIEFRIVRPDQEVRWVANNALLMPDAAGRPARLLGTINDITERKRAEDQVRESEAFNRSLMEGSADCIKVLDLQGRLLAMNEPGQCIMEIDDFGPLCGAEWASLWPDEARAEVDRGVAEARAGKAYTFEAFCPTAKGTPKWWEVTVSPVRTGDAGIERLLSVSRDITVRRETHAQLDRRSRQLDLLARSSQRLLLGGEPDRDLLRRVFLDVAEHLGFDSFFHYLPAAEPRTLRLESSSGLSEEEQRAYATIRYGELLCGRVAETRRRLIIEDLQASDQPGSELLARAGATSYAGFPLVAGGALAGTIAFISNQRRHLREGEVQMIQTVCEQVATVLERAASEARFRTLANSIPALMFVSDAFGQNTFVNQPFADYAGLAPDDLLGDGWLRTIHPDDADRAAATWEDSWREGKPYVAEYRFRRDDGRHRWHLVRGMPVRDEAGRIVEWVGTGIDNHDFVILREELAASRGAIEQANADLERRVVERTTQLQRTNQRLRTEIERREAAQAQLVQAQKLEALGQLTSGIAHDFNNVIAAISGGFEIIARRSSDPRISEISRHGADAAKRGGQLVKQLLAFARQQVLEPRMVDICRVLNEAKPLLAQSVGAGVALEINCSAELPVVRVDPVQLETALINLAANARDAMPGGGTLTISAELCPSDIEGRPAELGGSNALALRVEDSGCGMTPEVLQRVMEPFFTTKAVGKGTGLGLAMVHGFVVQSGGALRIESHVGNGTAITIFLPALPVGTLVAEDGVSDRAKTVETGNGEAILLVDDDPSVRAVTAAQLADLGYRVVEAGSGAEALALIARDRFELVLTDVVMPDMDGVTLAGAIRDGGRTCPVLFMTGHADRNRLIDEAVLDKPFALDALARTVARHLREGAATRDEAEAIDRLAGRLRADCLKSFLAAWRQCKGTKRLALFSRFDSANCEEPHKLVVVEVDAAHVPMRFRIAHLGDELPAAQNKILADSELDVTGEDGPASLEAAYRRSVRNARPSYDYARIDLGDGKPKAVERLILPWSTDGASVDRLVALVVLSDGLTDRTAEREQRVDGELK